jgi:2-keto-3-deoxy-L-rhamnonate aldolase RhmA
VRSWRTPEIARLAHASGHDVVWVDLEHAPMPLDAAAQICAAARDLGLVGLVRIREHDVGLIGPLLDGGAAGVIAPRVETVAQARAVVEASRFPPRGHRSAVASLASLGFERLPAAELFRRADRDTLVQVLIESPAGCEALEAIAALDGVDMVAIGTNDLCAEVGCPGDFRHPRVRRLHEEAIAACGRAGKPLAIGGIGDAAYAAELVRLGAAPLLMTAIDTDLFLAAARERVRAALDSLGT